MKCNLVLVIFFYFNQIISILTCFSANYYWRDYTGTIPYDAVPGGLNLNNETTYIGQGFVKDRGIIPGVIYAEKREIVVPIKGITKIDTYIKILCSPDISAFKWMTVSSKNFHTEMINKFPVMGGFEDDYTVNIGRVAYQGETITGKVVTSFPETATMYFIYKDQGKSINSYQVLIYDGTETNYTV